MTSVCAKLVRDMWSDCSRPRREAHAQARELVLVRCPRVALAYVVDVAIVYDEATGL